MFGNPIAGHIYAKGEAHPQGAFVVTATYADHIADGRNPGVDIGDGSCGEPLLAMCNGKVTMAQTYPDGSKVIRIRDSDHPGWEPAVAHLATIEVALSQIVKRGQRIGTLGKSGTTACHCHMGCKQLVNGAWVEVDIWPHLDQNEEGDMIPIATAAYTAIANKKTSVAASAGGRFRAERLDTAPVLKVFAKDTIFVPSVSANDGSAVNGSSLWYGGFLYDDAPAGFIFGWFHSSVLAPLEDVVEPGYSEEDLNNAKRSAARVVANAADAAASKF